MTVASYVDIRRNDDAPFTRAFLVLVLPSHYLARSACAEISRFAFSRGRLRQFHATRRHSICVRGRFVCLVFCARELRVCYRCSRRRSSFRHSGYLVQPSPRRPSPSYRSTVSKTPGSTRRSARLGTIAKILAAILLARLLSNQCVPAHLHGACPPHDAWRYSNCTVQCFFSFRFSLFSVFSFLFKRSTGV